METKLDLLTIQDAIDFFKSKGYVIAFDTNDIEAVVNEIAFTAAKVTQVDLLIVLKQAIDDALENDISFDEFKKTVVPKLAEAGWWGDEVSVTDPNTGETKQIKVDPYRLQKIFNTNIRTAFAEAQYQRIQEYSDVLPYLIYDAKNSEQPRLQHSAWDRLTLPYDDPWWDNHMPVKAWGCKCRVIQASEFSVKKVDTAPNESYQTFKNPRTGETTKVPIGVDPSFNYKLGQQEAVMQQYLTERIDILPSEWQAGIND